MNTCEIDNKNRVKKQYISLQAFHRTAGGRVQEITMGNDLNHETSSFLIRRLKNHSSFKLQRFTHTWKTYLIDHTNRRGTEPRASLGQHELAEELAAQCCWRKKIKAPWGINREQKSELLKHYVMENRSCHRNHEADQATCKSKKGRTQPERQKNLLHKTRANEDRREPHDLRSPSTH
jgi:hypothetical protein